VLVAVIPLSVYLTDYWFRSVGFDSPYFLIVLVSGAFAGALLVFPYNIWLVRRGLSDWPIDKVRLRSDIHSWDLVGETSAN
jgi:hypothetical protein